MSPDLTLHQWALACLAAVGIGVSKSGLPGVSLLHVVLFAQLFPGLQSTGVVLPMLVAGAIAHAGLGDVNWAVAASLLIGQIPGVWAGARLSSRYDGSALRWLLMVVLGATAMRLLGAPSLLAAGVALGGMAVVIVYIVRQRLARQVVHD